MIILSVNFWLLIIICILLLAASAGMFIFVSKRKQKADISLNSFSADVKYMLDRLIEPVDKINALKQLLARIENDKAYKKTPEWKKSVEVKVYEHMAAVYYGMGNEDKVIEATSEIIRLEPSNGMSYYNRGSIYSNKGDYQKALSDFDQAILLMPEYTSAYNNRGLVHDKMGKQEEALSDFDYAIMLDASAITYFNRANLYLELNDYEKAKEDYLKYLEIDTDDSHNLKNDVLSAIEYVNKKLDEGDIRVS